MKNLFFLALLANLVFFLWHYNEGDFHHAASESEFVTSAPKQILLVSELEKKPPVIAALTHSATVEPKLTAPAVISSQNAKNTLQHSPVSTAIKTAIAPVATEISTAAVTKTFYCYQVRGFSDKTAATHWSQQPSINSSSLQIKETLPVVADYLVNYPAAATLAESKKTVDFLKSHGVTDFFMINHGEFKGAISLAVFKNEARAIKAQRVFIQKGINAKVSKRYKTAATVSAQIKTEKNKAQLLATLSKYTRHPSVESFSQCE